MPNNGSARPLNCRGEGEEERNVVSQSSLSPRRTPSPSLNKQWETPKALGGVLSLLSLPQTTTETERALSLGPHTPPVNSTFPSLSKGTDE